MTTEVLRLLEEILEYEEKAARDYRAAANKLKDGRIKEDLLKIYGEESERVKHVKSVIERVRGQAKK